MDLKTYLAEHKISTLIGTLAVSLIVCLGGIYLSSHEKKQISTVIVYTSNPPSVTKNVITAFEKKTGIQVQPAYLFTYEALNRIQATVDNPICDIFWGASLSTLEEHDKFFQEYEYPEKNSLNQNFIDLDNKWYTTNLLLGIIGVKPIILTSGSVPQSWNDICKENKWDGAIIAGSPETTSYVESGLFGLYGVLGDKKMKQLLHKFHFVNDSKHVLQGLASGAFNIGFTLEGSIWMKNQQSANTIKMVYPSDGVLVLPEGGAIIKNAPHPKAARRFMEFLLSAECQQLIQQTTYRRPVRVDVPPLPSMPALSSLHLIHGLLPHQAHNQEQIERWKNFLSED